MNAAAVEECGLPDNLNTHSILAGLWNMVYAASSGFGAFAAGKFQQVFMSYPKSSGVYAYVQACLVVIMFIYYMCCRRR